jgi:hypothetical protein
MVGSEVRHASLAFINVCILLLSNIFMILLEFAFLLQLTYAHYLLCNNSMKLAQ